MFIWTYVLHLSAIVLLSRSPIQTLRKHRSLAPPFIWTQWMMLELVSSRHHVGRGQPGVMCTSAMDVMYPDCDTHFGHFGEASECLWCCWTTPTNCLHLRFFFPHVWNTRWWVMMLTCGFGVVQHMLAPFLMFVKELSCVLGNGAWWRRLQQGLNEIFWHWR